MRNYLIKIQRAFRAFKHIKVLVKENEHLLIIKQQSDNIMIPKNDKDCNLIY